MNIKWEKPIKSQTPIKKYDVEIKGSSGSFYTLSQICDLSAEQLFCTVPMSQLAKEPFYLAEGQLVVARGSAKNDKGWSKFSFENEEGAIMTKQEESVKDLRLVNQTPISATFMWTKVKEADSYLIYWDQGKDIFTKLDSVSSNVYTTNLASGLYKFKVAAVTICGKGSFSPALQLEMSAVP